MAKDSLGTKYPFRGYIGSHYGQIKYNGGCIRKDELYEGEIFPLPIIAEGFKIMRVFTWGYRIVDISKSETQYTGPVFVTDPVTFLPVKAKS
jgi:hypothetical protein